MRSFSFALLALGIASATASGIWTDHLTEFELPNGMKFVVLERPSSTSVSVTLLAKAGWADDPVGHRGLSRTLERMIEEGGYPYGSPKPAEERKAQASAEEAADKWEAERAKPTADPVDVARLRVEAERTVGYVATLSEPAALRQMIEKSGGSLVRTRADADFTTVTATMPTAAASVWFEGIGAWLKDPAWRNFYAHRAATLRAAQQLDEQGALLTALTAKAFPKHAWADADVDLEEIQTLRIRDLAAFQKVAFAPGNLAVAVVGNLSADQVRTLASKYFGSLNPQPAMPHNWAGKEIKAFQLPPARSGVSVFAMGYRRSALNTPDDPALDVAAHVLFEGQDAYLTQKLVRSSKAAQISGAISYPSSSGGALLTVIAIPVPGRSFAELQAAVQGAIDELAEKPLPASDLLAAKRRYIASTIRVLEDDDAASDLLARATVTYGSATGLAKSLKTFESITPEDIMRVVHQYLKADAVTTLGWSADRQ